MKSTAPASAAAFAIVAVLVGGSLLSGKSRTTDAPLPAVSDATRPAMAPQSTPAPFTPPEPGSAVPGIQFDQTPPAGAPVQAMEIVVKFKDDSKVKDIVDTFWKNAPAAKAKFEAFKKNRPEMADTQLDRVTYSNELVLVHKGGTGTPVQRLARMRDIAAKLKAASDIAYAEPNLTAQPGAH